VAKYYSPRDWDVIGFGNSRRYVRISDEEIHKRAAKKKDVIKLKKRKVKTEDFWKTLEKYGERK
tara:strand:- start:80 stop:271 length:192 start_codon:yes stop_codon:yes gene_type:complete